MGVKCDRRNQKKEIGARKGHPHRVLALGPGSEIEAKGLRGRAGTKGASGACVGARERD